LSINFIRYRPVISILRYTLYLLHLDCTFLLSFSLIFLFHRSVDDSVLQRAFAAIPEDSFFLIEDIDCAFPSRKDGDDASINPPYLSPYPLIARKSNVTLSGLLNVLDGVGSEEGKFFFTTVRCQKTQAFRIFIKIILLKPTLFGTD
jgi:hypothetical protein